MPNNLPSFTPQEDLPESQRIPEAIEEDRLSMMNVLARMSGEEYQKGLAWLIAGTLEEKRDYFRKADDEELEIMVAVFPLGLNALRQLLEQNHPMGVHMEDMVGIFKKLEDLTGKKKFTEAFQRPTMPSPS